MASAFDFIITRPIDSRLDGTASLLIRRLVVAAVRDRQLFLADERGGPLKAATRDDLLPARHLTDGERKSLRAAMKGNPVTSPLDGFDVAVPLPARGMAEFSSRSRARSPIGSFMRWIDAIAGERLYPSDVLVHGKDLDDLLREVRSWLRAWSGLKGEKLTREVNLYDLGGAPPHGGRGSTIAQGWVFFRSTTARRERGR